MADTESGNLLLQRDFGINLQRVGNVILRLGKSEAALQYLGKASKVLKGLVDADPRNAEVQRDLRINTDKVGDVLMATGQPNDALPYYKTLSISVAEWRLRPSRTLRPKVTLVSVTSKSPKRRHRASQFSRT